MSQIYILLVTGKLKSGHIETFVKNFTELAMYVRANEEGCLSYQLTISEEDPDSLIIFERYINKQYLKEVHHMSEQYKSFGATCREAGVEWESKSVIKYLESSAVGFLSKV